MPLLLDNSVDLSYIECAAGHLVAPLRMLNSGQEITLIDFCEL